jgi:hypothetical protein
LFDTTLIALQDVPSGIACHQLASRLVDAGASMTLVRIHGGYRVVASSVSHARANTERALAESDLNRVAAATGVQDTLALGATSTADGLTSAVRGRRADLLVLSAAQVLAPGENLLAALGRLTVPVAITSVAPSREDAPLRSVGIAYDSSAGGDRALTVARRLAGAHGAALSGLALDARPGHGAQPSAARAGAEIVAFAETVDLLVIAPRPTRPLARRRGPGTLAAIIATTTTPLVVVASEATLPAPSVPPLREDWVSAERLAPR